MEKCFLPRPAGTWGGRDGAAPLPRSSLVTTVGSIPQGLPQCSWVDCSSHRAPTPSAGGAIDLGPAGGLEPGPGPSAEQVLPVAGWGPTLSRQGWAPGCLARGPKNNCVHR